MDHVCAYFFSALFLLLLLALPSSSNNTTSRPRKLLQVDPTSIAAIIGPTCPQGVVPCTVPPCSIWPCLSGWQAVNDYCTCRCNCTSPPGLAELSTDISENADLGSIIRTGAGSSSSATAQAGGSTDNARLDAEETQLMQPQVPQQQVAGSETCAKLYQACTCSLQCCGNMVCGFRLRTNYTPEQQAIAEHALNDAVRAEVRSIPASNRTESALPNLQRHFGPQTLGNATIAGLAGGDAFNVSNVSLALLPLGGNARGLLAPNSSRGSSSSGVANARQGGSSSSNSSAIDIRGIEEQFVDTGGPSCRPAELVDLRTGVVNYGC